MNFDPNLLQPLKLRPTLIVGVGRFGGLVLQQIQRKLYHYLGDNPDFPIMGLLWLDDQSDPKLNGSAPRLAIPLEQSAALLRKLSGPGFQHIHRWWYPGWASLQENWAHSRPAGRVSFFHHYQSLRACLQESLARVRHPEVASKLLKCPALRQRGWVAQVQFDHPTQVHLVTGAEESTSGMVLDLSFLLRDLIPDGALTRTLWVSLIRSQGLLDRANAYALLKELNHYGQERHGFEAEWEIGKTVRPLWPAFEHCYLQTGELAGNAALVADSLIKELFLSDFAEQRRSLRLNLQTLSASSGNELQPRLCRNFSSLWLRRITFAHSRVQRACSAHLAARVLGSLADPNSEEQVLEFFGDERGTRRLWVARLLESAQDSLPLKIQRWGQQVWGNLQRGHRHLSQQMELLLQQGLRWLEGELLPEIGQQRQHLVQEETARLLKLCLESLERRRCSARGLWQRLPESVALLRRWGEQSRRIAAEMTELQRQLAGQIARQKAELLRTETRRNWDGRRAILLEHHLKRLLELHLGNPEAPGLFLARVLQEVHQEIALLCRDLARQLSPDEPTGDLSKQFHLLLQRLDSARQSFLELAQAAAPQETCPLSLNLVSGDLLEQEVLPHYLKDEHLAELTSAWLTASGQGLAGCLAERSLLDDLRQRCQQLFHEVPQDYALLLLLDRYLTELPELLSQELKAVRPETHFQVVAIPSLPHFASPLHKAQAEQQVQRLQQWLQQWRGGLYHFLPTSESEEMVFLSETVASAAHELLDLAPLRDAYLHLYTQGEALHIEAHDEVFGDLAVLTPGEIQAMHEARLTIVLGRLGGQLEAQGQEWYWKELLLSGSRIHPLGELHRMKLKLSKAPRLRRHLLNQSRHQLQAILEGHRVEPLLALVDQIAQQKAQLWSQDSAALELTFLREVEEKVLACQLYQDHQGSFEVEVLS